MTKEKLEGVLAPKKLKKYLKDRRFSYKILAGLLGVSYQTVANWMRRNARPDFTTMFVIQCLTSSEVRIADWLTDQERGKIEKARGAFRRIRARKPVPKPDLLDRVSGLI